MLCKCSGNVLIGYEFYLGKFDVTIVMFIDCLLTVYVIRNIGVVVFILFS